MYAKIHTPDNGQQKIIRKNPRFILKLKIGQNIKNTSQFIKIYQIPRLAFSIIRKIRKYF
jgi:hypothetical protein